MIYNLLNTISRIKPFRAKRLLTRDVLDEVLLGPNAPGLQYKGHDLHTLLVSTRGEWEIDETIIDYIFNSTKRIKDFPDLRLCFRLLASSGGEDAYHLLNRIIPSFSLSASEAESAAQDLALELSVEFEDRLGHRHFFYW